MQRNGTNMDFIDHTPGPDIGELSPREILF